MDQWPDAKIRSTALRYINKHTINPSAWAATSVGEIHPKLLTAVTLKLGELPIVSCFHSESSWYVLSTRRVLGVCAGQAVDVAAPEIVENHFGNFKGHRHSTSELMLLRLANGRVLELEYEAGPASMATIYYFRYWAIKHPVLAKLKA